MPVPYLDSKYYCEIQATGITANGTNVPWMLSEGKSIADLIALCYRSDGGDFVICKDDGTLVPFDRFHFNKTAKTIGLVYRDPSQSSVTGLGTKLYAWCGGVTVNVSSSVDTWKDNYDGTIDHALVVHGEQASANLIDASGNYTATDANITYGQTGKIKLAPEFNGNNSESTWGDITQINAAQKLTFMFWMSQNVLDATDVIFRKYLSASAYIQIWTASAGGLLNFAINAAGGGFGAYDYSTNVNAGTFAQIVNVFDGSQSTDATRCRIYTNKVLNTLGFTGTIPALSPNMSTASVSIGLSSSSFDGKLDEFRIVAGALSALQIADQYNNQNGFAGNDTVDVSDILEPPTTNLINGTIYIDHQLTGEILPPLNTIDGIITTDHQITGAFEYPDYITNVTERALALVKAQFIQSDNYKKYLEALIKPCQELEFICYQLRTMKNIEGSNYLLDLCGALVGAVRLSGQTDEDFRKEIRFRIFTNNSHGQPEVLIQAAKNLMNAVRVHYREHPPAGCQIECALNINPPGNIQGMLERIAPAGVFIQLTYTLNPEDNTFAFAGEGKYLTPVDGGTFDEYEYTGDKIIGKLVELI